MEPKVKTKTRELNKKDIDLLLFCLSNNPLNQSPYFRHRISRLKELLREEFEKKYGFTTENVISFDPSFTRLSDSSYPILVKFLYALFHKTKVYVFENNAINTTEPELMIPASVRFERDSATLVLYSEDLQKKFQMSSEKIQAISISSENFGKVPELEGSECELFRER